MYPSSLAGAKRRPTRLLTRLAVVLAGLMLGTTALAAGKGNTVRPEVGKPLQAAQKLLASHQYKAAMSKVEQAAAVSKLTPYEKYAVESLRASAAIGEHDYKLAANAYKGVLSSGALPANQRLSVMSTVARLYYTAKDYPDAISAIEDYGKAGGKESQILDLLPQAQYLAGRYQDASRTLTQQIGAAERAGHRPTELQLKLLASTALKRNDQSGYKSALQQLCMYYPQKSYWLDLILRTTGSSSFPDDLDLDVYRLRLHTDTINQASDYMEATELALQAGLPGEAKKFMQAGYSSKVLGSSGDVSRQKRLEALVDKEVRTDKASLAASVKQAAAESGGQALVNTGMDYVGYGQYTTGIDLIRKGIAKGKLKHPEIARLHLGYAYVMAGQRANALKVLRSIRGHNGTQELAKLWAIASAH